MANIDTRGTKFHLRVVVASPGDVQRERDSLPEVFELLNRGIAEDRGYHLDLYRWETDVYPRFNAQGPQAAVDSSLRIDDCDILIGVFWARFGTPTHDADSGTEHELRIAHEAWKRTQRRPIIMIYFNSEPFAPKTVDEAEQLRKVLELKRNFSPEALYGDYQGVDDFKRRVMNDLTQIIRQLEPRDPRLSEAVKPPSEPYLVNRTPDRAWENSNLEGIPLYTFCGLQREPRNADCLQNFKIDRQRYYNPNPVSYLWADVYRGSSISASVEEADPPHLSVVFENKPTSWPCSIAIRPIAAQAVTTRGRPILALDARLSTEVAADARALPEVFIAARVVNGWCQHWAYGPGPGRYRLMQVTDAWSTIEIPLTAKDWWLFTSDGNHCFGPSKQDFSIIASLVLEFGSDGIDRPGPGRATVLIRRVYLKDEAKP
jgi:hypothetical protein